MNLQFVLLSVVKKETGEAGSLVLTRGCLNVYVNVLQSACLYPYKLYLLDDCVTLQQFL